MKNLYEKSKKNDRGTSNKRKGVMYYLDKKEREIIERTRRKHNLSSGAEALRYILHAYEEAK